jgi:uncharacterized protein YndB with AHSA1/START domain
MSLTVELRRFLPVARERVFAAWSDPTLMMRWFMVERDWSTRIASDFRVGGSYRIDIFKSDGTLFVAHGTWLVIEPPSRLAFSWKSQEPRVEDSTVTVELAAAHGGTELVLRHEGLPASDVGRMHEVGWSGTLERLDEFFAAGDGGTKDGAT